MFCSLMSVSCYVVLVVAMPAQNRSPFSQVPTTAGTEPVTGNGLADYNVNEEGESASSTKDGSQPPAPPRRSKPGATSPDASGYSL